MKVGRASARTSRSGGGWRSGHLACSSALVVLCIQCTGPSPSQSYAATPAEHERASLVALARLEPRSGVIRVGASIDDTLSEILVKEGQQVEARAPLAHLASHPLRVAENEQLVQRLKETDAQLKAEVAYGESLITQDTLALRRAKLRSFEIEIQEAKVRAAEAELKIAQADAERHNKLEKVEPARDRDAASTNLVVKTQAVAEAEAKLKLLKEEVEVGVLSAESVLKADRAKTAKAIAAIPVESLRAEVEASKAKLEQTIVRAPIAGQVLKILIRPGERTGSSPLLEMGDTQAMYAVAEVHQSDIHLVKAGQKVQLTSPALGAPIPGEVEQVGVLIYRNNVFGEEPSPRTNARVFEVRVRLASSEVAARYTNLELNAKILLDQDARE